MSSSIAQELASLQCKQATSVTFLLAASSALACRVVGLFEQDAKQSCAAKRPYAPQFPDNLLCMYELMWNAM